MLRTNNFDARTLLPALFASCLVVGNVTAAKVVEFEIPLLGDLAAPAGFVAIGIAFLFSDLTVEFYGRDVAHKMVNATIVALALAWILVFAAIQMPAAPFYDLGDEFGAVLWDGTSVVFASIVTLAISQHVDVSLFAAIRGRTGFKHRWLRNVGSTATSQLLDTALFIGLAFTIFPIIVGGEATPLSAIPSLIAAQYALKMGVALAETPIFYLVTSSTDVKEVAA